VKISADCINQDHEALGSHTIDCIPLGPSCLYPTDLCWAESTGQPPEVIADLAKDQARHDEEG